MTVRLASCRDLSEDKEAIAQLAKSYFEIEETATPVATTYFCRLSSFDETLQSRLMTPSIYSFRKDYQTMILLEYVHPGCDPS
jgi:hypothetical protein